MYSLPSLLEHKLRGEATWSVSILAVSLQGAWYSVWPSRNICTVSEWITAVIPWVLTMRRQWLWRSVYVTNTHAALTTSEALLRVINCVHNSVKLGDDFLHSTCELRGSEEISDLPNILRLIKCQWTRILNQMCFAADLMFFSPCLCWSGRCQRWGLKSGSWNLESGAAPKGWRIIDVAGEEKNSSAVVQG